MGLRNVCSCWINLWSVLASERASWQPSIYQEERIQNRKGMYWVKKNKHARGWVTGASRKGDTPGHSCTRTHLGSDNTPAHEHIWPRTHLCPTNAKAGEANLLPLPSCGLGAHFTPRRAWFPPHRSTRKACLGVWFVPTTNIQHMSRKRKQRHVKS